MQAYRGVPTRDLRFHDIARWQHGYCCLHTFAGHGIQADLRAKLDQVFLGTARISEREYRVVKVPKGVVALIQRALRSPSNHPAVAGCNDRKITINKPDLSGIFRQYFFNDACTMPCLAGSTTIRPYSMTVTGASGLPRTGSSVSRSSTTSGKASPEFDRIRKSAAAMTTRAAPPMIQRDCSCA